MPINWLIQLIHILSVTCIAVSGYAYHAGKFRHLFIKLYCKSIRNEWYFK